MTEGIPQHRSIRDALLAKGYTYQSFMLGERVYEKWTAPNGWHWLSNRYRKYPFTPIAVAEISVDKVRAYDFAQLHGVVIPATLQTRSFDEAADFLRQYGRVLVKPYNGSGGRGVVLDITEDESLRSALAGDEDLIVQQQFIGEELRFTVFNGKVQSVVYRQTPRVVGDGLRSIAELIEIENVSRSRMPPTYIKYKQLNESNVDVALLEDHRIPADGEIIELSRSTMLKGGASFYGVTHRVHPSYVQLVEKLSNALSAPLIAVDFMVKDFTKPASDSNYVFIEFNTSPSPSVYSSLRGGDTPPIIDMMADLIDRTAALYRS